MNCILWPRQEVLQLVLTQLGSVGRGLSNHVALAAIKQLTKLQTTDGRISFDRWLIVAKDILKWNDYCIQLFWEMLCIANSYVQSSIERKASTGETVEFEYLSIFLILHTSEGSARPQSPGAAYDAVWPTTFNHMEDSPLNSPTKNSHSSTINVKIPSVMATPKSPSSPQSSSSSRPTSPKRSHLSSPRQTRTASQYLHTLRQKLPIILYALSLHDTTTRETSTNFDTPYDFIHAVPTNFALSRRAVDCLGLILCGGISRDELVPSISMLNPFLNIDDDPTSRISKSIEMIDVNSRQVSFSDLAPWLEAHMCVNEIYYPNISSPSLTPGRSKPHAAMLFGQNNDDRIEKSTNKQDLSPIEGQQPIRHTIPLSSLCRSKPTIMTSISTTVMHLVTTGPSRTNKSIKRDRGLVGRSHPSTSNMSLSSDNNEYNSSDNAMSVGSNSASDTQGASMKCRSVDSNLEEMGIDSGDDDNDISAGLINNNNTTDWSDKGLPQLIVNGCSKSTMYMLSPYSSASISACNDAEIVIGAVAGAITVTGCERVRITCACSKLIIQNCLECDFYVATLSRTVILGDSRSLTIAPFNVTYKDLDSHLRIAGIEALCTEEKDSSIVNYNHWSQMCDVNICLEAVITAGSPSGYAIDATDSSITLPTPHTSTASIISQEKFMFVNIPNRSIYQNPEMCPIPIPKHFQQEVAKTNKKIDEFYQNIKLLYPESRLGVANTLVSKKFLDWMARTGKAQQLLELIKLDADKAKMI